MGTNLCRLVSDLSGLVKAKHGVVHEYGCLTFCIPG